jgi:hypothetical protein
MSNQEPGTGNQKSAHCDACDAQTLAEQADGFDTPSVAHADLGTPASRHACITARLHQNIGASACRDRHRPGKTPAHARRPEQLWTELMDRAEKNWSGLIGTGQHWTEPDRTTEQEPLSKNY